jgi:hypothetical protein
MALHDFNFYRVLSITQHDASFEGSLLYYESLDGTTDTLFLSILEKAFLLYVSHWISYHIARPIRALKPERAR